MTQATSQNFPHNHNKKPLFSWNDTRGPGRQRYVSASYLL